MRMFLCLMVCMFLSKFAGANDLNVSELRNLYYRAASSKASAMQLAKIMLNVDDVKSDPILLCYRGASEMMQAKYAFNPINKLSYFKKGRTSLEKAILRDAKNIEMRFIRFSIQTNLPSILGYNEWIVVDKQFLLEHVMSVKDNELKLMVIKYLAESKYCTKEELKKIGK